jgi:hypothetical protein
MHEFVAMPAVAQVKRAANSSSSYLALSEQAQPPVDLPTRGLTQQVTGQLTKLAVSCKAGKAQSALPDSQSGAAAAEYSSRNERFLASATTTASPWFSSRLQRGAGSARRVLGAAPTAGLPQVSSPGESHPQALPEPYVRLSPHTAPINQSVG